MKKLAEAFKYCKEHKRWTVTTVIVTALALVLGGYIGTLAYYNGWLG